MEMGSSLYGLHLRFAQDYTGIQCNLGGCGSTNQDRSLHSKKVYISSGLVGSVIYQGDNTPARGASVHSLRSGHQVHLSVLEKSLESIRNPIEIQYSVPPSNGWIDRKTKSDPKRYIASLWHRFL